MSIFWTISLIAVSLLLFIQDWNHRWVKLWTVGLFAFCALGISMNQISFSKIIQRFALNGVLLVAIFAVLVLYFSIRSRKFEKVFNNQLGAGDICIILVLGLMLSPPVFILMILATSVTGIIGGLTIHSRTSKLGIPMVSYFMLVFVFGLTLGEMAIIPSCFATDSEWLAFIFPSDLVTPFSDPQSLSAFE